MTKKIRTALATAALLSTVATGAALTGMVGSEAQAGGVTTNRWCCDG